VLKCHGLIKRDALVAEFASKCVHQELSAWKMEKCIRCGKCHDACPQGAVEHDSEKIPQEVEENLKKTKKLMENFNTKEEKKAFLERMKRHFNKEIKVAEKSIERIESLMENAADG